MGKTSFSGAKIYMLSQNPSPPPEHSTTTRIPATQGAFSDLKLPSAPQVEESPSTAAVTRPHSEYHSPAHEAYEELIHKLFSERSSGKERAFYRHEADSVAEGLKITRTELVDRALTELKAAGPYALLDQKGHFGDASKIGVHFNALISLAREKVDFYVFDSEKQLRNPSLPLSQSYRNSIGEIIKRGEACMLMIAKQPPQEIADEVKKLSEQHLKGLMSLWENQSVRDTLPLSPLLKHYLQFGTVKLRTTGQDPEVKELARTINTLLEKQSGYEASQWTQVLRSVAQHEKSESLKEALTVCVPIVFAIKAVEKFFPSYVHAIGGALDDLFGAIIPDVSQSMGKKGLPLKERLKEAMPVLVGGAVTIPVSAGLGFSAAALYSDAASLSVRLAAGAIFAFACCAGTLGTSLGAFKKAWGAIDTLSNDPVHGAEVEKLSWWGKIKLAFSESILSSPFRIGHTIIGVPTQIGLGLAAGAFGFFHNPAFIMLEGMAETILGAATAWAYPYWANFRQKMRLRSETR